MQVLLNKYDKWTKDFMESWKELDWQRTLELLDKNVKYYENPIDNPCGNFEEVTKLWNVVADNQKDIKYKFDIVAFNDETCIINWQMTRTMTKNNTKQEIDGIFQISLDENGNAIDKPGRKDSEEIILNETSQTLLTIATYSITIIIGYYSDSIIAVDNFNGSTVNNYLSVMLPPLFFIIISRKKNFSFEKIIAILLILFSFGLIVGYFIFNFTSIFA